MGCVTTGGPAPSLGELRSDEVAAANGAAQDHRALLGSWEGPVPRPARVLGVMRGKHLEESRGFPPRRRAVPRACLAEVHLDVSMSRDGLAHDGELADRVLRGSRDVDIVEERIKSARRVKSSSAWSRAALDAGLGRTTTASMGHPALLLRLVARRARGLPRRKRRTCSASRRRVQRTGGGRPAQVGPPRLTACSVERSGRRRPRLRHSGLWSGPWTHMSPAPGLPLLPGC